MDGNNQTSSDGRGGYRQGAGRPVGAKDSGTRLSKAELANRIQRLQAIGALASTSSKVMHALGDAEYWLQVIARLEKQEDWDKIVALLQFHQQMRDGRPHQQISVTATNISVSAEEIARARAIVRTLNTPTKVLTATIMPDESTRTKGEDGQLNALGGQGVKLDGDV